MRFALELYNFSSTWHDDEHTRQQVDRLRAVVDNVSANLHPFHPSRSERSTTDTTGGDDRPSTGSKTGDTGDAAGQLEDSGYEVVPDVLGTDGGTWELIDKVQHRNHFSIPDVALTIVLQPPPHVRIVYRRSDPSKTKCIAKHVREGSNELAIHEYLQSRPSQSPHIISLIEAIPSTTREWLILPKLYSIVSSIPWDIDSRGVDGCVRLGWGLIKGLAYLHEHKIAHRDIKPGNLVRDGNFNLKIIDFDIAVKVQDENTEIDKYCGTEGWTGPEIGKQDGPTPMYSPIKADRWSCGRVILHHIMFGIAVWKGDHGLSKFANQLMAKDPQQRPSLLEFHVARVHKDSVSRSRQDKVDVDGESMDPPVAKRPRLE
jgi:serine/threonine protein kinase